VQGDASVREADGSFTFRGRSDEVINVGGNRIGTAEIENALLLDREFPGSPVRRQRYRGRAVSMRDATLTRLCVMCASRICR
jgi:non-ribosomal peptide synthetase component E (peptide arylation enzyme)